MSAPTEHPGARALVEIARENPKSALVDAVACLEANPDPAEAAVLHLAAGLAHRSLANGSESTHHLEQAARLAGDNNELRGEALRSLAFNYAQTGDHRLADETIEESVRLLDGQPADLSRLQQAFMLIMRGDHAKALPALDAAVAGFTRSGDDEYLELTLYNRALVHTEFGNYEASIADLEHAFDIGIRLDHLTSAADAALHLSQVLGWRGDIPAAMKWHGRSVELRSAVNADNPVADAEHAFLLIQARLMREAETALRDALPRLAAGGGNEAIIAMGRLLLADLLADRGEHTAALKQVELAREASPPDSRWRFDTAATGHRIKIAAGEASLGLLAEMTETADDMDRNGEAHAAALERFAAVEVALRCGDLETAASLAATARTLTNRGPLWLQTQAWTVLAQVRFAAGNRRGAGAAVRAGLRRLHRYRMGMGATDLRIHATEWGRKLSAVGLRLALESQSPDRVFTWSEQQRTTASATPVANPALDSALADLRRTATRARTADGRAGELKELARAEQRVNLLARQAESAAGGLADTPGIRDVQAMLDGRCFVEFVELDGDFWAVVVSTDELRLLPLTDRAPIAEAIAHLRLAAQRIARPSTSTASRAAAVVSAEDAATQLRERLIHPLGTGPTRLVVAPTGSLHSIPWGLVVGAPVEVTPNAATWVAARQNDPTAKGLLAVAGPDLSHAEAEASHIAATAEGRTAARTKDVLELISDAATVHFACHARARTDNPMFSSLVLVDGELTIHDIGRLGRVPGRIVLAACSGAETVLASGDEVLSLAGSFLALGARCVVAPQFVVSDQITAQMMRKLHALMEQGEDPALALFALRSDDDPATAFTAGTFACYGAA